MLDSRAKNAHRAQCACTAAHNAPDDSDNDTDDNDTSDNDTGDNNTSIAESIAKSTGAEHPCESTAGELQEADTHVEETGYRTECHRLSRPESAGYIYHRYQDELQGKGGDYLLRQPTAEHL